MKRFIGAHQVFTKRNEDGKLELIEAKTTDDFSESGRKEAVTTFSGQMKECFAVGKSLIEDRMK